MLAGVLFRLRTSEGTLIIEIDDPRNVVVEVDGEQAKAVFRPDGRSVELSVDPGERKLLVRTADGTVLKTNAGSIIEVSANRERTIRTWLEPPQKPVAAQRPRQPKAEADEPFKQLGTVLPAGDQAAKMMLPADRALDTMAAAGPTRSRAMRP